MIIRSQTGSLKPKAFLSLSDTSEPSCYTQAVKDPKWRQAMLDEYDAMVKNKTWTLVPPSSSCANLVGTKWVYRIKRNKDGTMEIYNARLVAKGYHQRPRVDFTDTYNPIVKPTTI